MEKCVEFLKKNIVVVFAVTFGLLVFFNFAYLITMIAKSFEASYFFKEMLNFFVLVAIYALGLYGLIKNKMNPNNKIFLFAGLFMVIGIFYNEATNAFSFIYSLSFDHSTIGVMDDIFDGLTKLTVLLFTVIIILEQVFKKEIKWSYFVALAIIVWTFAYLVVGIILVAKTSVSWLYIMRRLTIIAQYIFFLTFYYFYKGKDKALETEETTDTAKVEE